MLSGNRSEGRNHLICRFTSLNLQVGPATLWILEKFDKYKTVLFFLLLILFFMYFYLWCFTLEYFFSLYCGLICNATGWSACHICALHLHEYFVYKTPGEFTVKQSMGMWKSSTCPLWCRMCDAVMCDAVGLFLDHHCVFYGSYRQIPWVALQWGLHEGQKNKSNLSVSCNFDRFFFFLSQLRMSWHPVCLLVKTEMVNKTKAIFLQSQTQYPIRDGVCVCVCVY